MKLSELLMSYRCHDCNALPGEIHGPSCDVERCSACGGQRLQCNCPDHDPAFARWTGFWPGLLESETLGLTLNDLYEVGLDRVLFVKPKV